MSANAKNKTFTRTFRLVDRLGRVKEERSFFGTIADISRAMQDWFFSAARSTDRIEIVVPE